MSDNPLLASTSVEGFTPPCESLMCRREGMTREGGIGKCIGYHCGNCGAPSGMYGHYSGNPGSFSCVKPGGSANVEG